MRLDDLPTELLLHIYRHAPDIPTVLALAATNRRLHATLAPSQKLPILFAAAERHFGPLRDAVQLVTHNASQPAHLARAVPHSLALLRQLQAVGAVARRWADLYPLHRWRRDFEQRRALDPAEARRLRRAVYRLWLYGRAFHTPAHQRGARMRPDALRARAALLHGWGGAAELAEVEDVRDMLRNVLRWRICPSNGTVLRRYRRRFHDWHDEGDESDEDDGEWWTRGQDYGSRNSAVASLDGPLFHAARGPAAVPPTHFYSTPAAASVGRYSSLPQHVPGGAAKPDAALLAAEGWGDEVPHYYVLEDMLKLDPAQILWLRDRAPGKPLVEGYVRGLGEWFENNGETFGQTLEWVLAQRGEELGELKDALDRKACGIVVESCP